MNASAATRAGSKGAAQRPQLSDQYRPRLRCSHSSRRCRRGTDSCWSSPGSAGYGWARSLAYVSWMLTASGLPSMSARQPRTFRASAGWSRTPSPRPADGPCRPPPSHGGHRHTYGRLRLRKDRRTGHGPERRAGRDPASRSRGQQAKEVVGVDPDMRPHDLRHDAATLMAQMPGITTKELMARIGHSSPRAALLYQHATAERDRQVAIFLEGHLARLIPRTTDSGPGRLGRSGLNGPRVFRGFLKFASSPVQSPKIGPELR